MLNSPLTRALALTAALVACATATAQAQDLDARDQALLEKLVVAEANSEGLLGQALVARSVLNRVALLRSGALSPGTYMARGRSIPGVILGRKQYEPVSNGSINRARTPQQLQRARQAIALARDTRALEAALRRKGLSQAAIDRLLSSTGFRTATAYNDSSQNYDRQVYLRHVFNSDRYARRLNVRALFERYYAKGVTQPGSEDSTGLVAALEREQRTGPRPASSRRRRRDARSTRQASRSRTAPSSNDSVPGPQPQTLAPCSVDDPGGVTPEQLRQIMPSLSVRAAGLFTPYLNQSMQSAAVNTPLRRAAFLANLACDSQELGLFGASGEPGPRGANAAFERMASLVGVSLDRLALDSSPSLGIRIATCYWTSKGANQQADLDDLRQVVLVLHGPAADLARRLAYYERAKQVLGG
ncbi:MAG: cell wall hydrolase [Planctomycetota bacterium]